MNSTETQIKQLRPSILDFCEENNIPYFRLQIDYEYNHEKEKFDKQSYCPSLGTESNGAVRLPNQHHRHSLMTDKKIRDAFNEKNKDANAIALLLGETPFVLVDTDSKEATKNIEKVFKERGMKIGSTQTKNGHHYYVKIDGDKSKIKYGQNPSTKIDILGHKKDLAFEIIERRFNGNPTANMHVEDFIGFVQKVAKKRLVKKAKKVPTEQPASSAPQTIQEQGYAAGLHSLFNPSDFGHYHDWRMLANWCVVHNNFNIFHDISKQAPNYKDEADCKRCFMNEKANKWRISVGWGVNKAKQNDEAAWVKYKKKHSIRFVEGFTDYELAKRLQENYCDRFIAVGEKDLYYYDGTRWVNHGQGHFRRVVAEDLYNNLQSFIDHECKITQEHLADIYEQMTKLRQTSKQNSILTQFINMVQEEPDIWIQENDHLFPFHNGVFDIKQKKLVPHNSNYFNRFCFQFDYEPAVILAQSQTSELLDMYQKIFHEDEDLEFVKTAICKHLAGIQTKHILWLHGSKGNNGKSALVNILMTALGDYATTINTSLLQSKFDSSKPQPELERLMGKKLIFGSEVDTTASFNTQTIKTFTGGDPITGRALYSNDYFQFVCKGLFIVACNQFPSFTDNDKALHESRNRTIPIDTEFLKKEDYEEKIERHRDQPDLIKYTHLGDEKFISDTYQKEVKPHMIHILLSWLNDDYHLKQLKQPTSSKAHMQQELADTEEIALLLDWTEETKTWDDVISCSDIYKHALMHGAKPTITQQKFCKQLSKNVYLDGKYFNRIGQKRGCIRGFKLRYPHEEQNDLDY